MKKSIEKIAITNGYKKNLVQKLHNERKKALNQIQDEQKKKKYTTSIPYCKGAAIASKTEAANFNINILIKPVLNIYQHIKSDRDQINPLVTAGIHQIEYTNETGNNGYYIGVTKRKITERIKEHKSDIKYNRQNTALARFASKENIQINYRNTRKLSNYNNNT